MSYGLVCDTLHSHRKAAKAGLEAMGLWVMALSWSKDSRTRGRITFGQTVALAGDSDTAARCASALVRARLWDKDGETGWKFHKWHEYQDNETTWSRLAYAEVYERDGFVCRYCGAVEWLSVDHVIPRCNGGGDEAASLVVACRSCNSRKGGRTPDQAGMALRPVPEARI